MKLILMVPVALLASSCYYVGVQGFAAQKTNWNTGGTILYGVLGCDTNAERDPKQCHPLRQYDVAQNAEARRLARADAEREVENLKSACPSGWVVEERGLPGWVKAAPTVETGRGAEATVLVYRCQ